MDSYRTVTSNFPSKSLNQVAEQHRDNSTITVTANRATKRRYRLSRQCLQSLPVHSFTRSCHTTFSLSMHASQLTHNTDKLTKYCLLYNTFDESTVESYGDWRAEAGNTPSRCRHGSGAKQAVRCWHSLSEFDQRRRIYRLHLQCTQYTACSDVLQEKRGAVLYRAA